MIDYKEPQGTVQRTVPWVSSVYYRIRRGGHWPPVAPLADQGWCSAQRIQILMTAGGSHTIVYAAPVRTLGLRGSELTYFDNPSVSRLRGMREPAPFAQGSRGCSRTSATQQLPAMTCAVCCCSKNGTIPSRYPKVYRFQTGRARNARRGSRPRIVSGDPPPAQR